MRQLKERGIHNEICGANGIHVKPIWYEHQPETVIENDSGKILCDFIKQIYYFVVARKSEMINSLIKNTMNAN